MKRLLKVLLSLTLVVSTIGMSFPQVSYAAAEVKPVTHGNDVITYSVNEDGHFSIRTTEEGSPYREGDGNLSLLYEDGENNTSFATFRIDGEDYIFGQRYAYSLSKKARISGKTIQNDDSIITTYVIDDSIKIQQVLSFVSDPEDTNFGNVFIRYVVNNTSGKSIQVGARLLEDIMLGENDGAAIKIEDNFFDKEIVFEGTDVPNIWRSTDNEFAPNVVAYGYTSGWGNAKPDKMIVGHWQGLSKTAYDYTPNPSLNFTMESDYGSKDTAVAYYWNPKSLENEGTTYFETYYGLGQITGTELTYATNIFAPTQLVVNEEQTGYTDDGEFEIAVMLENNLSTSEEIYDVMAYLTFESGGGAVSLDNDAALKGVKLVKRNGQYTFRWKMKAIAGEDYNSIRYKVNLYDRRNLYKEGDDIPEGAQVGDVKMDEVYTVSKALILPSKSGKAPSVGFESVSPDEIYYSGKNLVTFKTSGTNLLVDKDKWELQYALNDGSYVTVPKDQINVLTETNSIEVNFEQAFTPGEMKFRMSVTKNIYTDGSDDENIVAGDLLYIPGTINVTKDKAAMQRTYGMLALVQEYNNGHEYTLPFVVADKEQLESLKKAVINANASDGKDRKVTVTISGDVRSIREGGRVARYVVYAQNKKAMINDLITYTSAIPMTIEYAQAGNSPTRNTIDYSSTGNSGISAALKTALSGTNILENMFPAGNDAPNLPSDLSFDFPYVSDLPDEMTASAKQITGYSEINSALSNTDIAPSQDFIDGKVGRLTITGMGVLGMNSKDGFDFWMDKFCMEFLDDNVYSLTENDESSLPVNMQLGGIGSVLNKVLEGMPVQIGGVRLVEDEFNGKDMLTFSASVDLTFLPGGVSADAKDVYFSQEGFEGLIVDASVEPEGKLGIVDNLKLAVGVDTYNNQYSIEGSADIKVVRAEVRFTIVKERRNNKWYLDRLVLAGGGIPGIPVVPGAVYITKLGGGVKNLQELTNPYYDGGGQIFTVVLIAGVNIVGVIEGDFEGNINKRKIEVTGDEAEIFDMDILKDLSWKLQWSDESGSNYFYLSQKATLNILDIIVGSYRLAITDSSFEGTAKASVKIPDNVDLIGGYEIGKASLGLNLDKVWGSVGINLPWPLPSVNVGATYYWRGKFNFNIGEAGPVLEGPEGALYHGVMTDENNESINYVIGTNVSTVDGQMTDNSVKAMAPVQLMSTSDGNQAFRLLGAEPPKPDDLYVHKDGTTTFDGQYVYKINLKTTEDTNLVLRHETADPETENALEIYQLTGEVSEGKSVVDEPQDSLAYVEHLDGDSEYVTVTGFTERPSSDYIVVSDTPLSHYLTYKDGEDYTTFANANTYEFTMDTTSNTRLAFTYEEDMDIKLYKVNNADSQGLERIEEVNDIVKKHAVYNGRKIVVFEGFPEGESGATYYVSASKPLEEQNLLDAKSIVIPESSFENGSLMVEQLLSESDLKSTDILYITDADGNLLDFFKDNEAVTSDENYDNMFGQINKAEKDYYTMIYPFEEAGTYYIYSTADIDVDKSKLYEIETMPQLDDSSMKVMINAQSELKRDVSWDGKFYRYSPNEAKETGRTTFTYYLANKELQVDDEGEPLYAPERLLGSFEPVKGDRNYYTIDIPRDVQSGDYRVLMVMSTEGLSQEYAYSEPFNFVNPNMPNPVKNVTVVPHGNGYLDVKWDDQNSVKSYYIEVYDDNNNMIDAFGTAEVDGDKREVLIGGIYENFDPDHPENSTVSGLETGKTYIVGVSPVKKVDETLDIVGSTTYSSVVDLPEPNPASLTLSLDASHVYSRTLVNQGVDENGQAFTDTVDVLGSSDKNPKVKVVSDQAVTVTAKLNEKDVFNSEVLSDNVVIPLEKVSEGLNYLDVIVKNEQGDISYDTLTFYVDSRAPELMISEPTNNQIVSEEASVVNVEGKTEKGAQLTVNGTSVTVGDDGFFSAQVPVDLTSSKTKLEMIAKDDFDNETVSRLEVIRNLAPVKGIKLSSDVPEKSQTVQLPIYSMTTEEIINPFTGTTVSVSIAESDEVIGYTEKTVKTNVVEMGESYQLQLEGLSEEGNPLPLESEKINYEIVQGDSIGSIDQNGLLKVDNSGTIVVKASYTLLDVGNDEKAKSPYAFTQYMTVTSDYKDIYSDLPDPETTQGDYDDGSNNHSGGHTGGNTGGNSGGNATPPVPSVQTPLVKNADGRTVGQLDVTMSQDKAGKTTRDIRLNEEEANKISNALTNQSNKSVKLYLPEDSNVDETYIHIPRASIDKLKNSDANLQIANTNGSINMLAQSLEDLSGQMGQEVVLKVETLSSRSATETVKKNLSEDDSIKSQIQGKSYSVEGQPVHIESNVPALSKSSLEVVIPIDLAKLPKGYDAQMTYLKSLQLYVEHDDGTTELLPIEVVSLGQKDGKTLYGAKVSVNKLSVFTLLSIDGIKDSKVDERLPYLSGYSNGIFKPSQSMTRAELAAVLNNIIGDEETLKTRDRDDFTDVPSDYWGYQAIMKMKEMELMNGVANNQFQPNRAITRAEVATIVSHYLGLEGKGKTAFKDTQGHWAANDIALVADAGIFSGDGKGTFRPDDKITRAEVVVVMNKILGREKGQLELENPWKDVPKGAWYYEDILEATVKHAYTIKDDFTSRDTIQ